MTIGPGLSRSTLDMEGIEVRRKLIDITPYRAIYAIVLDIFPSRHQDPLLNERLLLDRLTHCDQTWRPPFPIFESVARSGAHLQLQATMGEKNSDDKALSNGQGGYDAHPTYHQQSPETYTLSTEDEAHKSAIDGLDPVYAAKARVLNRAIQDIGMGSYQWQLFVVIGFGWAQDNLWPIVTSLILPAIVVEFNVGRPPLLTLAQNIGLLAGAAFWGFGCDLFGRRWGFNLTLGEHSNGDACNSCDDMFPILTRSQV